MAELDKIVLEFREDRKTLRTVKFEEIIGEQAWSEKDVAVGPLYVQKEAMEMIGNPSKIRVTIEPM